MVQATQSYTIQREPIYGLNQKTASDLTGGAGFVPIEVVTNYPVEVRTNFTVEVDDFETANIMDTIRSGHYETIELNINQIELLKGSEINLRAFATKNLLSAWIVNDDKRMNLNISEYNFI